MFLRNKRLMTVTQVTLPESDTRKETEQILDYPSDMLCQCLTMLRPFVRIQKIIKVIRSLGVLWAEGHPLSRVCGSPVGGFGEILLINQPTNTQVET